MNGENLFRLGVSPGEATRRAIDFVTKLVLSGGDKQRLEDEAKAIVTNPAAFTSDPLRGESANAPLKSPASPRAELMKCRQWGERLEPDAVVQMEKTCLLPATVARVN